MTEHFGMLPSDPNFTAINYCPDYEDPKSPLLAPSDSRFNLINYIPIVIESAPSVFGCPICAKSYEDLKQAKFKLHASVCGHVCCGPCFLRCIGTTHKCPKCRQHLKVTDIIALYL